MVVPDQRKPPAMAGVMRTNGAVTGDGMRPNVTIGSEKTMRISLACARLASDPSGPVLTMLSAGACANAEPWSTSRLNTTTSNDRTRIMKALEED